jgi:hypothetical protein
MTTLQDDPVYVEKTAEEAKSNEKDTSKYQHFPISGYAKRLFEDEKGLQYALQFLGHMAGKANKEAWEEVYKEHPELKEQYAVFDEAKGDIYVVPKEELDRNMAEMLGMEIQGKDA